MKNHHSDKIALGIISVWNVNRTIKKCEQFENRVNTKPKQEKPEK